MLDLWTDLLGCLQLRAQDGSEFEGDSQRLNYHRVFKGQLLEQFIRAASNDLSRQGDQIARLGPRGPAALSRRLSVRISHIQPDMRTIFSVRENTK